MNSFIDSFFQLFYPNYCLACNKHISNNKIVLCEECYSQLGFTYFANYIENPLYEKFIGQANIEYAFALCYFYKGGILQHCLHALKYNERKDVGIYFGKLIGNELINIYPYIDLIIPIPLHPKKEKIRGYNQSEMIAKGISQILNVPINTNDVLRTKFTETQTKKSKWERYDNLNGVFAIKNTQKFANKHLLIVDDVITTGATTVSLIELFKNIPNVKISVACIGTPDII